MLEGGVPGSDLDVEVRRTRPRTHDELELPPPLAEPRLDFRVDRATALSYEVKAGEYIQIIDVEGKQCSDFLAFHRRKLEDGIERGFDPTITRTLMGNAFPQPGLYSKFYDLDMDVLVEVIRDTVGRHDSFLLACTSRYYENLGYFGHTNCTDNFNRQLETYAIAPRKGWQALNFFYNTMFATDNLLVFDEPWSRPGDYVLLRAATDLVCASSACPDDVDPANGWDPTEVHVRVYSPEHTFSAAIAHRVTPDAEPTLTTETGFHPRIAELTSRTTEYNGYWLPTSFDNHGATDEYWACREKAAIMDLSPLRKFEVLGPDAEALLQATVTRDIRRLADGQVVYTAMCNEAGGMIDDATIFRIAETNFRFVGGSEYDGVWLSEQAARLGLHAFVKESTDHLHNVAVQGPASRELLKGVVWVPPAQTPFEGLGWFRFSVGRIGGPKGVPAVISRTGYTGELGYEIFCHPNDAPAVWDAVWEAGEKHGLAPLGLDALDILRIEAGPDLRGLRVRRPGRPLRGGDRVHGHEGQGRGLRRSRGASRAPRAPAADPGRAGAGGQRAGRPRRRRVRRPPAGGRRDQRDPLPGPQEEHRARPRRGAAPRPRHRARGRQARRPSEADPGAPSSASLLRPREDATSILTMGGLVDSFTPEQVESFHRDGFLVVEEGLVSDKALELLEERYLRLFDGEYETGIKPDEVNWVKGRDPEDRTRQLCNAWRADTVIAAQVLSARIGRLAAQLMGYPGVRILQDNVLWKPPGTKAIGFHQDGSYADYLVPPEMVTCWMSLHETQADAGPIAYVRGSNHWPWTPPERSQFHAPEDWLAGVRDAKPEDAEMEIVPVVVKPGGGAFHHNLTWHGSEPEHERHRRADGARLPHASLARAVPPPQRRPDLLALPTPRRHCRWTSRSSP